MTKSTTDYWYPAPLGNHTAGKFWGIPAPPKTPSTVLPYRGFSLAQPINMRERFKTGDYLLGCATLIPSAALARIAGVAGFDFAFVDWEHTPMSISEVTEYIRWINYSSEGRTAPIVRVPNHDHHNIAWVLDAGAGGIVLPHSETEDQAKAAVAHARFPNEGGRRSYPPAALIPGMNDGSAEDMSLSDILNRSAVIMQIESVLGADNAAKIAAVPGVDALMVGLGDLSFDVHARVTAEEFEEEFGRCISSILSAAKANNLPVISFAPQDKIASSLAQGFSGLIVAFDAYDLAGAFRRALNAGFDQVQKYKTELAKENDKWEYVQE